MAKDEIKNEMTIDEAIAEIIELQENNVQSIKLLAQAIDELHKKINDIANKLDIVSKKTYWINEKVDRLTGDKK